MSRVPRPSDALRRMSITLRSRFRGESRGPCVELRPLLRKWTTMNRKMMEVAVPQRFRGG